MGKKAIFPGSFDPPTLGHIDIIEKAASMFEEVFVVVSENSQKRCLFTLDERLALLKQLTAHLNNVRVFAWEGLMTDFMKEHDARILVRGVRSQADFSYEMELASIYKLLDPVVQTVFVPSDPSFLAVRSSTVKELASFNVDISAMVAPIVAEALLCK